MRGLRAALLSGSLSLLWTACGGSGPAPPPAPDGAGVTAGADRDARLLVFAAASLRETLSDIAGDWSAAGGGGIRFQLDASSTLARQLEAGAHADLFITAAPEWLDRLPCLARADWLTNRLVAVARRGSGVRDLRSLRSLALAAEQVPAGRYAREALARLAIDLPSRVLYGATVRDVLSKVSAGGADAGIVYATDVLIDPEVEVIFEFPATAHAPIRYSVGLLSERGRAFHAFLFEAGATSRATARGFGLAP